MAAGIRVDNIIRKFVLLWAHEKWVNRMGVQARLIKDFERTQDDGREPRFREHELVADLYWEAGDEKSVQSVKLQPMNAIELRAFGCKCIEVAGVMDDMQKDIERKQG
jgi:hypothetical protein